MILMGETYVLNLVIGMVSPVLELATEIKIKLTPLIHYT